jgi:cytidine deaminase
VLRKLKDIGKFLHDYHLSYLIGVMVMPPASNTELVERAKSLARPKKLSKDCVSAEVGCALITSKNNLFVGVSLDCACGIGTCAEHGAIQNMLANGESRIKTIVAVAEDGTILPPCGRCRELIYQVNGMNREANIIVGKHKTRKLKDLLPEPWQKAF